MTTARDRLKASYWNSLPKTGGNPGGMSGNGHVINFPEALKDVGDVAQEVVDDNDAVRAALIAQQAAIVADNDATQAAILADNDATAAEVAGSAATAVAARDAAEDARDEATAQAATATTGAADAKRTVSANFPDRLNAAGTWFSEAATGDPGTIADPTGAAIVNAAGYGYVYSKANAQGQLYTKGLLSAPAGKVYEVEAEIEQTIVGGAETPAARVGLQGLDAAFASTGAAVNATLTVTPAGVTIIKARFGYTAPAGGFAWPQPGAAVWLRPYVIFGRKSDNSGAVAASTARVRRLTVRDVTAVVAAEIQAAAAAASAASVALASQADAEAGTGVGLMSSTRVGQAIAAQATPIGGTVKAAASPGARFLLCDGASYLKASYPALGAVLGDRYAAFTIATPTVKTGYPFYGLHVEPGLVIAVGVNGNIQTSPDTANWTERALATTNFNEALGVVKLAAKYLVYGRSTSNVTARCLVSSANGTTGWADVSSFGTFNNGQGGPSSIAYGVINGAATVVAVGGANAAGASAQLSYSTDEAATWSIVGAWTGAVADGTTPKALIANGVLGLWCPNPATFKRATTLAAITDVTGPAAAPSQVDLGNGLFVCLLSTGDIFTSPDLLTFTERETPLGYPQITAYLGFFNGAHHFRAPVGAKTRVYATPDFATWYRVPMSQSVGNVVGVIRPFGTKFLALSPAVAGTIAVVSTVHDPVTEFPLPSIGAEQPSWIKAL